MEELTEEQREILATTGTRILTLLSEIEEWARRERPGTVVRDVATALDMLMAEPAIARVRVEWQQPRIEEATLVICRGAAAGAPRFDDNRLASYRSPMGRLAEFEPGEVVQVRTPTGEREARIVERQTWRPARQGGAWDGTSAHFALGNWRRALASIRRHLEQVAPGPERDLLAEILGAAEQQENLLAAARRTAIDRIALRDQPLLDQYQGEVMRLPLDHRVVLLGPPGTGKTTTLIKRIAEAHAVRAARRRA